MAPALPQPPFRNLRESTRLAAAVSSGAGQARWSVALAASTLAIQNGIVMAFAVLYLPLVWGGRRRSR